MKKSIALISLVGALAMGCATSSNDAKTSVSCPVCGSTSCFERKDANIVEKQKHVLANKTVTLANGTSLKVVDGEAVLNVIVGEEITWTCPNGHKVSVVK